MKARGSFNAPNVDSARAIEGVAERLGIRLDAICTAYAWPLSHVEVRFVVQGEPSALADFAHLTGASVYEEKA